MWEVQRHRLYSTGREGGLPDRCLKIPRHQRRAGVSPLVCHRIIRVLGSPSAARRIKRRRRIDRWAFQKIEMSNIRQLLLSTIVVALGCAGLSTGHEGSSLQNACTKLRPVRPLPHCSPRVHPPIQLQIRTIVCIQRATRPRRNRVPLPLSPSPSLSRSPSLTPKLLARQARTASTTSRW